MELLQTECCGIREIAGIEEMDTPTEALLSIIDPLTGRMDGAFVFFSVTNGDEIGDELSDFIRVNGLGTVIRTEVAENPNSGNDLVMYVWTVNNPALVAWRDEQRRPAGIPGRGGVDLNVNDEVRHQTFGIGIVRALREGFRNRVGVEFVRERDGQHNLDGAISTGRGMWVNQENVRALPAEEMIF